MDRASSGAARPPMGCRIAPVSLFIGFVATAFFTFSVLFSTHIDDYFFSSTPRKATDISTTNHKINNNIAHSPSSSSSSIFVTLSKSFMSNNNNMSNIQLGNRAHQQHQQQYGIPHVPDASFVSNDDQVDSNRPVQVVMTLKQPPPPPSQQQPQQPQIPPPPPQQQSQRKQQPQTLQHQHQPSNNENMQNIPEQLDTTIKSNDMSSEPSTITTGKSNSVTLSSQSDGKVSWTRSWPLTEADDDTGLYRIARAVKITNETLLNYFHLHKTGGVSIKAAIIELLTRPENLAQLTKRGQPLRDVETCYKAISPLSNVAVREVNWRCDFRQIREMSTEELRSYDIVLGHQYWERGSLYHFGAFRDVKYFSIFRHPLSRKLSFFYHFFVRNAGANEKDMSRDHVLDYVFGEGYDGDARMRDGGVNYYASRFMSNGTSLFIENQYRPNRNEEDAIIERVVGYLDKYFVFVGLQTQNEATKCMMERTMQVFAHVHGIDTLIGSTHISEKSRRQLNKGEYTWTARKLWMSMNSREKARFRLVDRIDLAIYRKAVERFRESVRLFGCEDTVDESAFEEDRLD